MGKHFYLLIALTFLIFSSINLCPAYAEYRHIDCNKENKLINETLHYDTAMYLNIHNNINNITISYDKSNIISTNEYETSAILYSSQVKLLSNYPNGFYLDCKAFEDVVLSPNKLFIAMSIHGSVHDWVGLLDIRNMIFYQIILYYGSNVEKLYWSPNSRYIIAEGIASGDFHTAKLYDIINKKEFGEIDTLSRPENEIYFEKWDSSDTLILRFYKNKICTKKIINIKTLGSSDGDGAE